MTNIYNQLKDLETSISNQISNKNIFNQTFICDMSNKCFSGVYTITIGSEHDLSESDGTLNWINYESKEGDEYDDDIIHNSADLSGMFSIHPYLTTAILDDIFNQSKLREKY